MLTTALDKDHPIANNWQLVPVVTGVALLHALGVLAIVHAPTVTISGGDEMPVYVELITEAPKPPVIPEPAPAPPPPAPEPDPEPEPDPVVAEPPPLPEPKPVFEVEKKPRRKPKPKPELKPKPKPKPRPKPPEPPPSAPEPPAEAPPAPAAPSVEGTPNAPAGATPQAGSGRPGPSDEPVRLNTKSVSYVRQPEAVYPAFSKRAGETGTVHVDVLIDEKGLPVEVTIRKSSGYPRLDDAAVAAARGALFSPHMENGVARRATATIPFVFELE